MAVLFLNFAEHEPLKKEPYASFLKRFDIIKESVDGEQIELRVGGRDGTFSDGFYVDETYFKNPRIKIEFAGIPKEENGKSFFVRVVYSYEGKDCCDLDLHFQRVKELKKRAPYYYIPGATHFEFSSQIDDEYKLIFDVVADREETVQGVCCSLISLIISIFSFEN